MTADARPSVFVGPRPFRTGEPLFGRDREIADLTGLLRNERVVLLYAPSGAGKTSLVQAGLIPRLRPEPAPARRPRARAFDVPTVHPTIDPNAPAVAIRVNSPLPESAPPDTNRYVLSALLSLEARKPRDRQLSTAELAALTLTAYLEHEFPDGKDRPPVFLVFDQFEEILTLDPTEDGDTTRVAFFAQLGAALKDPRRWALIVIREDHLAEFDPYLPLLPNRLAVRYRLERLDRAAALEAIIEPPKTTDLRFDPEFAGVLVDNLRQVRVQKGDRYVSATGPHVEPVHLQVVCKQLWDMDDKDRKEPGKITAPDFDRLVKASWSGDGTDGAALTGVDAILAGYYAATVARAAGAVSERRIRDWFERELITRARTRKPVPSTEHPWVGLPRDGLTVLDKAYLIREDSRGGVRWLELAHDRLVEPVLRDNARWRKKNLQPFQLAAAAWVESKERRDELLVSGAVLKWGEDHRAELTDDEKTFLQTCQGAAERYRARARMWLSWGAAGVLLALLAGAGVLVAQNRKQVRAQSAAREYERRESLFRSLTEAELRKDATRAQLRTQHQIDLARLDQWDWGQQGDHRERPPSAPARVRSVLWLLEDAARDGVSLNGGEGVLRSALQRLAWQGLTKFDGKVSAAAFSRSGQLLAVYGTNGLHLWRLEGGRAAKHHILAEFDGTQHTEAALRFTADESHLWVHDGQRLARYPLNAPALKPQVDFYEVLGARTLFVPTAAGRESNWIVIVGANGQGAALWWPPDAKPGKPIPFDKAPGVREPVTTAVGFAPGSSWMYTGTADGRVLAWDLSGSNPVVTETGIKTGSSVTAIAVHPSGKALAVAEFSPVGGAALWPLRAPNQVALDNNKAPVRNKFAPNTAVSALAFHPHGDWLALTRTDRTVELLGASRSDQDSPNVWKLPGPPPMRITDPVLTAVFDGGGVGAPSAPKELFLTGAPDGSVRLWDLPNQSWAPLRLAGLRSGVSVTALSPDRAWAVVGCEDGTAHLWDVQRVTGRTPGEPRLFYAPSGIDLPTLSRDGRWAAGTDGIGVWVWDLHQQNPLPRVLAVTHPPLAHLVLDGPRPTAIFSREASVSWDLTLPDPRPVPNPAYAPIKGTNAFAMTADHRWVVGITDKRGQPPSLLLRKTADANWLELPLPDFVAPKTAPESQTSRGPESDRPLLAVGGPDPRRPGDPTITVVGAVWRRPLVWQFDPASGKPGSAITLTDGSAAPPDGASLPPLESRPAPRSTSPFVAVAASADGRFVATANETGTVRVWEVTADRGAKLLRRVAQPSTRVTALALSADGTRFATGGADGSVRVWSASSGGVPTVLTGHTGRVKGVHFVHGPPTGPERHGELRLVTFGEDETVRVWTLDRKALFERARQLADEVEPEVRPTH